MIDLTGKRFGKLLVLSFAGKNPRRQSLWTVRCDCGNDRTVLGYNLRSEHTRSCGCLRGGVVTHGMSKSPEYRIWRAMLNRCSNPKDKLFHRYGGRGITVCDRWHTFANFISDMGIRPSSVHTIERLDNNGNYNPENCKWATRTTQCQNTSRNRLITFRNKTLCLSEWAKRTGIKQSTIAFRLKAGWPINRALTEVPIIGKNQFGCPISQNHVEPV